MKKNKGFTLIELLVTIVILAVILLISVPSIMGVLEKSKKQAFIESGISIVKSFTKNNSISDVLEENHIELPSNGSSKSINLSDINYENGDKIIGDIVIKNIDGVYSYYLYITDGEYVICDKEYSKATHKDVEKGKSCGEQLLYPTIENKYESQTYYIDTEITESMILSGVTASDTRDGNITEKIRYESNINVTKTGEYHGLKQRKNCRRHIRGV